MGALNDSPARAVHGGRVDRSVLPEWVAGRSVPMPAGTPVGTFRSEWLIMPASSFRGRARAAFPFALPLASALALALQPAAGLAQTGAPVNASAPGPIDDVFVTATRVEQKMSDTVADVSVIDRETIENSGVSTVVDLLGRVPGVEFTRNGGPGATTSVYIRGGETRFTAVYLDGVRIDSQSTGGASWQAIPLEQIDRIEVLRGPAAAVYGSDAISGVVQLFTRKGKGPFTPYAAFGVASHRTYRAEAGFSGSNGAFDYSLGLANSASEGFNARPVPTQNPDKDGYRSKSANARLGFQIDRDNRVEATLLASDIDSKFDSGLTTDDRSRNRLQTAGLSWTAQWTDAYKTRVSLTDSRDRYATRPMDYRTDTRLRGYLFQNELRLGASLVTAALERREDDLVNDPIDRGRHQNALALGYGWQQGAHTVQANLRRDDDSEFGGQTTGSLGYAFAITPQWRVSASGGTVFRAPTLYQRFSEYGVAGLQPEKSRNVEIGLRYSDKQTSASVTLYRNRLRNLITFSTPGPCLSDFGCYANTANAEYSGITLAGQHRIGVVTLRASLDFQDPRDRDTDRQLARRARRHGTVGADGLVAGWTLGGEMQFSGRRYDDPANTTTLGGYGLINLYASKALARDWTLNARIDNLADKPYETVRNYATPGRVLYVGLRWSPR